MSHMRQLSNRVRFGSGHRVLKVSRGTPGARLAQGAFAGATAVDGTRTPVAEGSGASTHAQHVRALPRQSSVVSSRSLDRAQAHLTFDFVTAG